ncbi:SEC-C metal-binding domain-containing protein [Actinoplanes palleronii]
MEKLGGKDPCPCGSGRRFPPVLPQPGSLRRHQRPLLRP